MTKEKRGVTAENVEGRRQIRKKLQNYSWLLYYDCQCLRKVESEQYFKKR